MLDVDKLTEREALLLQNLLGHERAACIEAARLRQQHLCRVKGMLDALRARLKENHA